MATLNKVVHQLQAKRRQTEQELEKIEQAIKALAAVGGTAKLGRPPGKRRKPKFSAAGIARIRAAQKKRWAKIKAAQK